jgi:hypothetical protein
VPGIDITYDWHKTFAAALLIAPANALTSVRKSRFVSPAGESRFKARADCLGLS